MIESLISSSLHNRVLVLVVATGLFAWKIYSLHNEVMNGHPANMNALLSS
jgi:Cu/Ag efflux pump CusA